MRIILPRRMFLTGLVSALTAPAIVRAESLMPVEAIDPWIRDATVSMIQDRHIVRLLEITLIDPTADYRLTDPYCRVLPAEVLRIE